MQPSQVPPPPSYPPPVPPPPPYPPPSPPPARPSAGGRAAVGLLLLVPATIAWLIGYLVPTVRTALWSLQHRAPLSGGYEWAGFDNYDVILEESGGPLAFALLLAVAPLLTLLVVAPVLALLAHAGGKPARLMVRLALVIPTVCFAPVGFAIAWLIDRYEVDASARGTVWLAVALTTFGVVCGVGVTAFLGVLRGRAPGRSVWPAGLTVAGVGLLAVVAVSLQAFTYPQVMTGGGPQRQTATPLLNGFQFGLQLLDYGTGAAAATLVLIPVLLLGLAAGLLVVFSGLRIEYDSAPAPAGRAWAAILAGVGLLAVLAITLYGIWPWLTSLGQINVDGAEDDAIAAMMRAWLPPLASTVIGVGLAAVAGFGIGALRPLGRFSEVLLLPFAPWLFIGIGPLFLVKWDAAQESGRIDNVLGLIPPIWLAVPALFIFTLLFRGLARQHPRLGPVVLRSLPMVAFVGAATWLVQSQSLLWGLLASFNEPTAPVFVLRWVNQFGSSADSIPLGLVLPIPAIVIFALGLGLLHTLYLDRIAIRTGRDREEPPRYPPPPPVAATPPG